MEGEKSDLFFDSDAESLFFRTTNASTPHERVNNKCEESSTEMTLAFSIEKQIIKPLSKHTKITLKNVDLLKSLAYDRIVKKKMLTKFNQQQSCTINRKRITSCNLFYAYVVMNSKKIVKICDCNGHSRIIKFEHEVDSLAFCSPIDPFLAISLNNGELKFFQVGQSPTDPSEITADLQYLQNISFCSDFIDDKHCCNFEWASNVSQRYHNAEIAQKRILLIFFRENGPFLLNIDNILSPSVGFDQKESVKFIINFPSEHQDGACSVQISHDGSRIFIATNEGYVKKFLFDQEKQEIRYVDSIFLCCKSVADSLKLFSFLDIYGCIHEYLFVYHDNNNISVIDSDSFPTIIQSLRIECDSDDSKISKTHEITNLCFLPLLDVSNMIYYLYEKSLKFIVSLKLCESSFNKNKHQPFSLVSAYPLRLKICSICVAYTIIASNSNLLLITDRSIELASFDDTENPDDSLDFSHDSSRNVKSISAPDVLENYIDGNYDRRNFSFLEDSDVLVGRCDEKLTNRNPINQPLESKKVITNVIHKNNVKDDKSSVSSFASTPEVLQSLSSIFSSIEMSKSAFEVHAKEMGDEIKQVKKALLQKINDLEKKVTSLSYSEDKTRSHNRSIPVNSKITSSEVYTAVSSDIQKILIPNIEKLIQNMLKELNQAVSRAMAEYLNKMEHQILRTNKAHNEEISQTIEQHFSLDKSLKTEEVPVKLRIMLNEMQESITTTLSKRIQQYISEVTMNNSSKEYQGASAWTNKSNLINAAVKDRKYSVAFSLAASHPTNSSIVLDVCRKLSNANLDEIFQSTPCEDLTSLFNFLICDLHVETELKLLYLNHLLPNIKYQLYSMGKQDQIKNIQQTLASLLSSFSTSVTDSSLVHKINRLLALYC